MGTSPELVTERFRKPVRCASGALALISIETRSTRSGEVVRYNLAFICHAIYQYDNGRVLGYDNAHSFHERHSLGRAEKVEYTIYEAILERFQAEVDQIRRTS